MSKIRVTKFDPELTRISLSYLRNEYSWVSKWDESPPDPIKDIEAGLRLHENRHYVRRREIVYDH